jgi:molybdenum cofactor biosynthesis enzyme
MSTPEKSFTHINPDTNYPTMVDVSDKQVTKRVARAQSIVVLGEEIMKFKPKKVLFFKLLL